MDPKDMKFLVLIAIGSAILAAIAAGGCGEIREAPVIRDQHEAGWVAGTGGAAAPAGVGGSMVSGPGGAIAGGVGGAIAQAQGGTGGTGAAPASDLCGTCGAGLGCYAACYGADHSLRQAACRAPLPDSYSAPGQEAATTEGQRCGLGSAIGSTASYVWCQPGWTCDFSAGVAGQPPVPQAGLCRQLCRTGADCAGLVGPEDVCYRCAVDVPQLACLPHGVGVCQPTNWTLQQDGSRLCLGIQ